MKYDIILQPIRDEKVRKLVAKNISSRMPSQSFTILMERLISEKVVFAKNIAKAEVQQLIAQLNDLHVQFSLKEIQEVVQEPIQETKVKSEQVTTHIPKAEKTNFSTISTSPSKPQQKKTTQPIAVSITLVAVVTVFALIAFNQKSAPRDFTMPDNTLTKKGSSSSHSAPSQQYRSPSKNQNERNADTFLDSADQKCISNGIDSEQLYRFAISYNRYNKDAWFGLLNCYRSIGKYIEAQKVEKEMRELFGDSILDPKLFPEEYGVIEAIEFKNGAVSLVYKTNEQDIRILYSELFQIVKRYGSMGKYNSMTTLVKQKNGSGIFITTSLSNCISYSNFIQNSTIQEF